MQKIHLKAPQNWINDPNGFIYYKGKYHLFYQCFPFAPMWGRMHWGHAVSLDLVTWEHLGIALYPTKTNDRSGCFSGSAVESDGNMHLFYTGVNYDEENPENINLSNRSLTAAQMKITSADGFSFDNIKDKKTVIEPIADENIGSKADTRDPKVWRGRDAWYMILGSTANNIGRFLFYKSTDLENWTYVNSFSKENMGRIWECPDYFEVGGTGIVLFSPIGILTDGVAYDAAAVYALASFDGQTCTMEFKSDYSLLDYGMDLYAPQSTVDKDGRRVLVAWARMPEAADGKWNGMMSLPRVVETDGNHVYFRPHPNIKAAFSEKIEKPCAKDGYLIKTNLKNGENLSIGGYKIRRENDRILTDRTAVFVKGNARYTAQTPVIKEGCALDIYVDSHLIEIFVNDGEYVLSGVVYSLTDEIIGENYALYAAK